MDAFTWTKEHTLMLKRLVLLHYTKGKPCTVIYAKFNELASTTLSSQNLPPKDQGHYGVERREPGSDLLRQGEAA